METDAYYSAFAFWGGIVFLLAAFVLWFSGERGGGRKTAVWPELGVGVMMIADSFAFGFRGKSGDLASVMVHTGIFISIFASCWIAGLFFRYFLLVLPMKKRKRYRDWWVPAILLVGGFDTVLLIISQFTGILYTIDEENLYHRGSFMGLAMALQFLLLVSFLALAVREKSWMMAVISSLSLIALGIQTFVYGYPLCSIVCGIIAIVIYLRELLLLTKKSEGKTVLISEKEDAIREMQTRIALSQIKPHFLYNALNSIYVLCGRDVSEARNAISNLSDYLRNNMASIDSKLPIPLSREMELVESYLAIEKIRFPEELNYTILTPVTHFSLPALTIQPLVENAVRHGIMPLDSGGIITITTRETEQEYIVSISDNGVGFDTEVPEPPEGSAEHIGIKNVRERLRKLSGGNLEIRSEKGHGTEAIIRIPKQ